ncbi:MAG: hypothetical protein ACAH12_03585 [Methylophilaceae bacterium]
MNFEDLEQRLNARIMEKVANATATFGFGDVRGIFTKDFALNDLVQNPFPAFQMDAELAVNVSRNVELTINDVAYSVTAKEPDGSGWVLLKLELVDA